MMLYIAIFIEYVVVFYIMKFLRSRRAVESPLPTYEPLS